MSKEYNACDYEQLESQWIELAVRPNEDLAVLNELLDRKQEGIPKALRLAQSIEDIEKMSPTYPYVLGTKLNEGVTFADQLRFRGAAINYIKTKTPLEKCNVDKERNFNLFFQQTRARAFDCLARWIARKATALEVAYVLACLEAVGFGPVPTILGSPTYWRNRFVERLQDDPRKYRFCSIDHTRRLCRRSIAHMDKAATTWNAQVERNDNPPAVDSQSQTTLMMWIYTLFGAHLTLDPSTMLFSGMRTRVVQFIGQADASDAQSMKKKKRVHKPHSHGPKKGKPSGVQKNTYPDKTHKNYVPWDELPDPSKKKTLMLNLSTITHEIKNSEALAGLVAKFPGWCPTQSFLLNEPGMDLDAEEWGLPVMLPGVYWEDSDDEDLDEIDEEGMSTFGLRNALGQLDVSGSRVGIHDVIKEIEKTKLDADDDDMMQENMVSD